ncbi:stage II sporulation protein M [Natronosporangium hydrolyticum]|uniref:Stage II sporulation protein M n=1 Tax=Natronosporangium hydrolyticum TaxID=2811111 RepID=A0A895YKY7_9ACTN|nr:stage II sporulation protein M [Natronosporangium hydrolyticum]QSB15963.1 stage II sporulation protein M [Natronosporangium hydrolyticum]
MDLDAFVTAHSGEWRRLQQLTRKPRRRLTPAEIDELVALHHRAATHLSTVRSQAPDPAVVARLSQLVFASRAALTPTRRLAPADVARFFLVTFPGEVFRTARWSLGVAAAFVALSGVRMATVAADPGRFFAAPALQELVDHRFEDYYSTYQPQNFTVGVWTNNAYLAAICLAGGILIFPVLLLLWYNAENLGLVGGAMLGSGRGDLFFQLLLIHGLLELTAIFIAAGVGLRIGWAWIAPGADWSRTEAVGARGRAGMAVALGLVPVLFVSALVEAFITPAPWPIELRLAIGTLVWLGFVAYVWWFGAAAVRGGASSDVDRFDRPAAVPASS